MISVSHAAPPRRVQATSTTNAVWAQEAAEGPSHRRSASQDILTLGSHSRPVKDSGRAQEGQRALTKTEVVANCPEVALLVLSRKPHLELPGTGGLVP